MCMGCVQGPWTDSNQFVLFYSFYSLYSIFGTSLYNTSCALQRYFVYGLTESEKNR